MSRPAISPHDPHGVRRPRRAVVITVAAVVLVAIAAGWHVTALSAYRATGSEVPLADRLASARLASTLEPWEARFAWRVVSLRGLQLLEQGKVDAAFWLVQPYAQIVRGDPVYRSAYQRILAVKAPLDSRKAHVQHAREQTGGVLLEQDVQH